MTSVGELLALFWENHARCEKCAEPVNVERAIWMNGVPFHPGQCAADELHDILVDDSERLLPCPLCHERPRQAAADPGYGVLLVCGCYDGAPDARRHDGWGATAARARDDWNHTVVELEMEARS